MSEESDNPYWGKVLVSVCVSGLILFGETDTLETYLLLPGLLWLIGGTLIAASWTYVKYSRYVILTKGTDDCSACGLFGHKLPWILMIGCGLASLIERSTGWEMFCAYAIALSLFSLSGSLMLMLLSERKSAPKLTQ